MTDTNSKRPVSILDLTYVAAGAALIAVCSWVTIQLPSVPITLQTFAVFAALGILGGGRGTAAVAVYIALGAAGLPVFSGFRGGVGTLVGVTGGYIVGFLFSAGVYWLVTALWKKPKAPRIVGMTAGLAVCYAFGTVWFAVAYSRTTGAVGFGAALMKCVVPFLLPDAVKLALAFLISAAVRKRIKI